jgi:hypothetical protein
MNMWAGTSRVESDGAQTIVKVPATKAGSIAPPSRRRKMRNTSTPPSPIQRVWTTSNPYSRSGKSQRAGSPQTKLRGRLE